MDPNTLRLEYFKDEDNKKMMVVEFDKIEKANVETQKELAKQGAVDAKFLAHYVNVTDTVLLQQDAIITDLEKKNDDLQFENDIYKKEHGPLDAKLIQEHEMSRKLVPLNTKSQRLNNMLVQADKYYRQKI